MKILRSVTQRGFSFGTAGYFSVIKPNSWFPATRLPGAFRYRRPGQLSHFTAPTSAPNIITLAAEPRRPFRQALILLLAGAIVLAMLWWIMHP